jgi:DNA-directed RNA polymerase subunit H
MPGIHSVYGLRRIYGGTIKRGGDGSVVGAMDADSTIKKMFWDMNGFLTYATDNNYTNGIIVVTDSRPSETVLGFIREYISKPDNMLIQLFELRKLQINIARHRDVPKHRILPQEEMAAVMKKYNMTKGNECPWIDSQDAMAKWIGARPGDMVEIQGLDEASAKNVHYGYCMTNVYDR